VQQIKQTLHQPVWSSGRVGSRQHGALCLSEQERCEAWNC
jgi:hypothetical protein